MKARDSYNLARKFFDQLSEEEKAEVLQKIKNAANKGKFELKIKGNSIKSKCYRNYLEDYGYTVKYDIIDEEIIIQWKLED